MADIKYYDVILKPVITEKSMNAMGDKKYTFMVHWKPPSGGRRFGHPPGWEGPRDGCRGALKEERGWEGISRWGRTDPACSRIGRRYFLPNCSGCFRWNPRKMPRASRHSVWTCCRNNRCRCSRCGLNRTRAMTAAPAPAARRQRPPPRPPVRPWPSPPRRPSPSPPSIR